MLTNQFYAYLAALVKGEPGTGSLYIAVGSGDTGWDSNPPAYQRDTQQLTHEIARKSVDLENIQFLDTDGNTVARPTSELRIITSFPAGEGTGTIRECGLFGGAGSQTGSGRLLSYFTHPRIDKSTDMSLERSLRLSLTPGATETGQTVTRYLGNSYSEELHDLENENAACQINEIRYDRRAYFSSPEEALQLGYDYCAFCFGRNRSQR